jgi:hypothetical protein
MVAAKLANMKVGGKEANAQICAIGQVPQPKAADMLNVGRRSVQHARTVLDKGHPELLAALQLANPQLMRRNTIRQPLQVPGQVVEPQAEPIHLLVKAAE